MDHFLPKSLYPQFGIAFENLIPVCRDCNEEKLTAAPQAESDTFFHPYFEECSIHSWLVAKIDSRDPLTFSYGIASDNPRTIMNRRLEHQFQVLNLATRFATDASGEFTTSGQLLTDVFNAVKEGGLIDNLKRTAESASKSTYMPWKAAMYYALAADRWFTSGGFIRIQNEETE